MLCKDPNRSVPAFLGIGSRLLRPQVGFGSRQNRRPVSPPGSDNTGVLRRTSLPLTYTPKVTVASPPPPPPGAFACRPRVVVIASPSTPLCTPTMAGGRRGRLRQRDRPLDPSTSLMVRSLWLGSEGRASPMGTEAGVRT